MTCFRFKPMQMEHTNSISLTPTTLILTKNNLMRQEDTWTVFSPISIMSWSKPWGNKTSCKLGTSQNSTWEEMLLKSIMKLSVHGQDTRLWRKMRYKAYSSTSTAAQDLLTRPQSWKLCRTSWDKAIQLMRFAPNTTAQMFLKGE